MLYLLVAHTTEGVTENAEGLGPISELSGYAARKMSLRHKPAFLTYDNWTLAVCERVSSCKHHAKALKQERY